MPINALSFLPKSLVARLTHEKPAPVANGTGTMTGADGITGPKLQSGKGVSGQVDGIDSTRNTSSSGKVGGTSPRPESSEPAKAQGDPLGWAARATATVVKLGSIGAGVGLVIFGVTKVLAGMTLVSGGFPLFAAGAGLALAGAAVFKIGGLLSKAIRGK